MSTDSPNTHEILLKDILNRLESMDEKIDELKEENHQLNLKYENLRVKSIKWSTLGAGVASLSLTQWEKLINFLHGNP